MSSIIRRIGKRIALSLLTKEEREARKARPQVMAATPNGGYIVLHPTRGWRTVSPLRAKLYGYCLT